MKTRNIISELYQIDIVEEGTRRVAKWPATLDQYSLVDGRNFHWHDVKDVPTYVLSITHESYDKMKRDLEEFHNILHWLDDNPEVQISYGMWDTVRLLKL
jgi:hypothetical protein